MRYVVGSMMVIFFLAGIGLFVAGVLGLIRRGVDPAGQELSVKNSAA